MTEILEVEEAEALELYMERGWTDGLPIVLPTPARVDAMLSGVPHPVATRQHVWLRETASLAAAAMMPRVVPAGAKAARRLSVRMCAAALLPKVCALSG